MRLPDTDCTLRSIEEVLSCRPFSRSSSVRRSRLLRLEGGSYESDECMPFALPAERMRVMTLLVRIESALSLNLGAVNGRIRHKVEADGVGCCGGPGLASWIKRRDRRLRRPDDVAVGRGEAWWRCALVDVGCAGKRINQSESWFQWTSLVEDSEDLI